MDEFWADARFCFSLSQGGWQVKGFDAETLQLRGRVPKFLKVFERFWSFSLGSRPAVLPSRPYFKVCVPVAVFQSTETFL